MGRTVGEGRGKGDGLSTLVSGKSARRRGRAIVGCALVAAWAIVVFNFVANANSPGFPTDDGYITFSYARTLAEHGALALTPTAAHVQGYSNFLWVVVLAVLHLAGLSIPTGSRIAATACVIALVPATYGLARRVSPSGSRLIAIAAAAVVGVLPGGAFFALSGLETSLATLALTLALVDLARPDLESKLPMLGILAFVGFCLVRPEGLVVWLVVTIARFGSLQPARLHGSRRLLGYWFGLFLGPMVVYEIFEFVYFGTVVPNTVTAKMGSPDYEIATATAHYLSDFFGPLVLFLILAAVGLSRRRAYVVPAAAVVTLVVLALASAVQDGYPYQRYLFVGVPALLALSVAGGDRIVAWVRTKRVGWSSVAIAAICVAFAIGVWQDFAANPWISPSALTGVTHVGRNWSRMFSADTGPHDTPYPGYYAVSKWLLAHGHPDQSVALEEIGIVSYYSNLRIVDTFGLANRAIARYPGRPAYKSDPTYLFQQKPDYYIVPVAPGAGTLVPSLPGDARYARTATFAFGYDLKGVVPDPGRFDAIFARQAGLVSVNSLDKRLTDPTTTQAPALLGQQADVTHPNPGEVTAARYRLRTEVTGVRGTPEGTSLTSRLDTTVPLTGTSTLTVGTGPVSSVVTGRWTVTATSRADGSLSKSVSVTTQSAWQPIDIRLPLTSFRGQNVAITLDFTAPSGIGSLSQQTFVEPRIITSDP